MNRSITLGKSRRLVLPKPVGDRLHLREGTKLSVELEGDSVRLSAQSDKGVRLVREGKLLVATGFPAGTDIVAAIHADREERDAQLARPFQARRKKSR